MSVLHLTSLPSFLRHSSYPHTSTHNTPIDPIPLNGAFTPVDPSLKQAYMTPDLYGQPSLGKAVASSTPTSPRTRAFPREPISFKLGLDTMSTDRQQGKGHVTTTGLDMLSEPKMALVGNCSLVGTA